MKRINTRKQALCLPKALDLEIPAKELLGSFVLPDNLVAKTLQWELVETNKDGLAEMLYTLQTSEDGQITKYLRHKGEFYLAVFCNDALVKYYQLTDDAPFIISVRAGFINGKIIKAALIQHRRTAH